MLFNFLLFVSSRPLLCIKFNFRKWPIGQRKAIKNPRTCAQTPVVCKFSLQLGQCITLRPNKACISYFSLPAKIMFSFKIILGSLAVAVICDLIAMQYYPQGGSRIRGSLEKFRNLIHKLADLFCNNPAECKQVTDEFFGILSDIPQDVVVRFMEFVGNAQDHGSVQKNQDAAKKGAVDFTNGEVEVKGDERKAEMIIKTLKFASYNENNLCDLKEGIPPEEYDVTVDEIADLTSMPENLKKTIKRAKNFTSGNVLAVNKLQFKAADGNLVFGRVAVIRRGKVLDMAYSLHSVEYELMPKQRQPDNADKLEQFSGSLYHEEGEPNDFEGVSIGLRDDFLAFFHRQAIKGFVKHCDYVLKAITHGDGVVRALGVQNGDETGKDKTIYYVSLITRKGEGEGERSLDFS